MNIFKQERGLTLIELMVTTSIILLSLTLATPPLNSLLIKTRISSQLNKLSHAIRLAREAAITSHTTVTLCRSSNGTSCKGNWREGMIVFMDENADRKKNNQDYYLHKFEAFPDKDRITWRAFGNRQFLQMKPSGFTRYQNGTFTYCPKEGVKFARALIINAAGRVRFSKDADGDGINEDAKGKPLKC